MLKRRKKQGKEIGKSVPRGVAVLATWPGKAKDHQATERV